MRDVLLQPTSAAYKQETACFLLTGEFLTIVLSRKIFSFTSGNQHIFADLEKKCIYFNSFLIYYNTIIIIFIAATAMSDRRERMQMPTHFAEDIFRENQL